MHCRKGTYFKTHTAKKSYILNHVLRERGMTVFFRQLEKLFVGRKGSLLTETAIFLPLFIISVLTLCALIKAVYLQVFVFEALADEARKASVEAYVFREAQDKLPDEISDLFVNAANRQIFLHSVRSGLEERGIESDDMEIDDYDFEDRFFGISDLTRAKMSYHMKLVLPVRIVKEISIENTLYFRSWNGEDNSGELFSFERMAADEDGTIVYIFPHAGAKYHKEGCRYIRSYAIKVTAGMEIFEKYEACPLCRKEKAKHGETVYIFQYGNSYHSAECHSVKKYVIEMEREDAIAKNYSACSVCGG